MNKQETHVDKIDWGKIDKRVLEIMEGVVMYVRLKNVKTHALREPLWRIQTRWEGGIMDEIPDVKAQDAEVTQLGLLLRWFTSGPAFLEYSDAVAYVRSKYISKGYKREEDYIEHEPKPYAKQ
tara:strand:- start:50 stop:418 length:369 start_codon:yes stop_codon:yes gene_type:complete